MGDRHSSCPRVVRKGGLDVEGYKWFDKPRTSQRSQRGEGGVGFLVRECLVSEQLVVYEKSVRMKVQGERGRLALYIGCVYMPTNSTSVAVLDTCFERLKWKTYLVSGKTER